MINKTPYNNNPTNTNSDKTGLKRYSSKTSKITPLKRIQTRLHHISRLKPRHREFLHLITERICLKSLVVRHFDDSGYIDRTQRDYAEALGWSVRKLKGVVADLKAWGYLEVEKRVISFPCRKTGQLIHRSYAAVLSVTEKTLCIGNSAKFVKAHLARIAYKAAQAAQKKAVKTVDRKTQKTGPGAHTPTTGSAKPTNPRYRIPKDRRINTADVVEVNARPLIGQTARSILDSLKKQLDE